MNIRSSLPGNGYGSASGTSMASPHVAGTVALMWSVAPSYVGNIDATIDALDVHRPRRRPTCSAAGRPADNNVWGEGTLDAFAAVELRRRSRPAASR